MRLLTARVLLGWPLHALTEKFLKLKASFNGLAHEFVEQLALFI
jgi:hypothetical protein